jgi:hypothetical protein
MRNEEPAQSCVLSREPKNLATKWQAHRVRTVYGSDNRHQHSAGPSRPRMGHDFRGVLDAGNIAN